MKKVKKAKKTKKFSFVKQYITKPRTVGAILPSSKYLAEKMTRNIDFDNTRCIVEYGAGTGVFTEKILKKRTAETLVLLFETNEKFYNLLKERFSGQENLHIINDSAAKVGEYLQKYEINKADFIISGLPFASLPQEVSENILEQTVEHLKQDGKFITFQYTLFKKEFIKRYFADIKITRELRNIPPAYVFCCGKDSN